MWKGIDNKWIISRWRDCEEIYHDDFTRVTLYDKDKDYNEKISCFINEPDKYYGIFQFNEEIEDRLSILD